MTPDPSPVVSAEAHRDAAAEAVARAFHEAYERLAPSFGYETRPESRTAWEDVPEQNRTLMIATAREVALSHPDDLVAVMGMEAAGQDWWCPEARRISGRPTCLLPNTDLYSHLEVDVFLRRRTQGGDTDGTD